MPSVVSHISPVVSNIITHKYFSRYHHCHDTEAVTGSKKWSAGVLLILRPFLKEYSQQLWSLFTVSIKRTDLLSPCGFKLTLGCDREEVRSCGNINHIQQLIKQFSKHLFFDNDNKTATSSSLSNRLISCGHIICDLCVASATRVVLDYRCFWFMDTFQQSYLWQLPFWPWTICTVVIRPALLINVFHPLAVHKHTDVKH